MSESAWREELREFETARLLEARAAVPLDYRGKGYCEICFQPETDHAPDCGSLSNPLYVEALKRCRKRMSQAKRAATLAAKRAIRSGEAGEGFRPAVTVIEAALKARGCQR